MGIFLFFTKTHVESSFLSIFHSKTARKTCNKILYKKKIIFPSFNPSRYGMLIPIYLPMIYSNTLHPNHVKSSIIKYNFMLKNVCFYKLMNKTNVLLRKIKLYSRLKFAIFGIWPKISLLQIRILIIYLKRLLCYRGGTLPLL